MPETFAHIGAPSGWTCEADPEGESLRFRHETAPVVVVARRCTVDHHVIGRTDMWEVMVTHGYPDVSNTETLATVPTTDRVLALLPVALDRLDTVETPRVTPGNPEGVRYPSKRIDRPAPQIEEWGRAEH
ncbi:hypothetical protein [Halomarina ordinaria]|uniref:Uncharacterized protein n=1 Tax=Halomarina ordinaria TaxID=3033939 RepID=A0ABD5U9Y0_9EURY|nr:hypothetical protein [Halomarina sp. PSRA2]